MLFLNELIATIGTLAINTISFFHYPGVFILMTLESMVFPLPSELVMPFAGFLVWTGKFNFWLVILASSLGSLFGSVLSYYIGKYGGEALIRKFGRYLLLDETDLQKTQQWFQRKGDSTIFIGRFIPVVRHLISIPAGLGEMNFKKFCLYTVLGATVWNTFLIWLGMILGDNWSAVKKYSEFISVPVAILLFIGLIYFVWRHIKNKKR